MRHFLDFDEWMGVEDRDAQFDFECGDELDVDFERWCEARYDEYLDDALEQAITIINSRTGGAS